MIGHKTKRKRMLSFLTYSDADKFEKLIIKTVGEAFCGKFCLKVDAKTGKNMEKSIDKNV